MPLSISSFSSVNCLGAGSSAMLDALRERRSGLRPCDFETATLDTYIGRVQGLDELPIRRDLAAYDSRNNRLAQWALEADEFAGAIAVAKKKYALGRIGVFLGTSTSGILQTELAYRRRDPVTGALPADFRYAQTHSSYSLGDFVRRYLNLDGPTSVVSSACSSSAKVFGTAARMIEAGVCDAALVGGVDTLCLTTLYGFHSLGLVSAAACRPFDRDRDGISIGEGAGFALLERLDAVAVPPAAVLLGVGESSDAYHMSTPHPQGKGAMLAMRRALEAAQISADEVDYINLHGTATKTNDVSEDKAVCEVFGAQTPCSSTKGLTGHLLGAAGITEALISILALQNDLIPGSANTARVDSTLRSNYQIENSEARICRVVTNSFGFGGTNCSLVIARS